MDTPAVAPEASLSPTSDDDEPYQFSYNGCGDSAITSLPGVHTAEYHSMYKYSDDLTMFPLLLPPERDALFGLPSHRELDLGRLSDQRPKDLKADSQLLFALQGNHLVPREDEAAESIISLPRRISYPKVRGRGNSHSLGDNDGRTNSQAAKPPLGPQDAPAKSPPLSSSDAPAGVSGGSMVVDPAPRKYTLYL